MRTTQIFVKIGNRVNGETDLPSNDFPPGSISDVNFTDIRAYDWGAVANPKPGHSTNYTLTVEGLNASHLVGPIRLEGLTMEAPGGGTEAQADVDPPLSPTDYQPRYDGVRPAWGMFVRYAKGVEVVASTLAAARTDGRPALVLDHVEGAVVSETGVDDNGAIGRCQLALRDATGEWSDPSNVGLVSCEWAPEDEEGGLVARKPRG